MNYFIDNTLFSILPIETGVNKRVEKSESEVYLVVQHKNEVKAVKILDIRGIKDKKILIFYENNSLLLDCIDYTIYSSKLLQMNNNNEFVVLEREYYNRDLETVIQSKSLSNFYICDVTCSICDILMILSEYNVLIGNLKSSNVVIENGDGNIKLCDLFLNEIRKEEDLRLYDICFKSPEELNGCECNERSVIWPIGCILYEMMCKKLPFEDNNMNRTKENILICKYNNELFKDDSMKEIISRILKVKNEDRMSLKELRKEMRKMSEILKDEENNLMILKEKKEVLFKNNYVIITLPIIFLPEYYLKSEKWKDIQDKLIESYNIEPNERILSILLMMKCYKRDKSIKEMLKFQIHHYHQFRYTECYLDEMIFNIHASEKNKEIIIVNSSYICYCEKGINYFFRIMKLISPTKLEFAYSDVPIQNQLLFGSYFTQLSNLQELVMGCCKVSFYFIQSFVKSVPFMKLEYVSLSSNPIGPTGFGLLLPFLHLLINKNNELCLYEMDLNDESMILLSEELYKYPKLKEIDIRNNNNIHSVGLKALFSKFPISKVRFYFNGSKELLIDKNIPELIKYIECGNGLYIYNCEIDDEIFEAFIQLRLNDLTEIEMIDLSNNKLRYNSIRMLINNLSSLPNLKELRLYGNEIGDEGMRIISPNLHLLLYEFKNNYKLNCSEMGLSSIGLRYLLDGLKSIYGKIDIDISDNNINSDGVEYLMSYVKENDNIETLIIDNNQISNTMIEELRKLVKVQYSQSKRCKIM